MVKSKLNTVEKGKNNAFLIFFLIFFVITISAFSFVAWKVFQDIAKSVPDNLDYDYKPIQSTVFYDKEGQVINEIALERRSYISIENIPDKIKEAFISAEDGTFYHNSGIDFIGLFRALVNNALIVITRKKNRFTGASTITQQVARNLYLSKERTITRKVKEFVIARKLTNSLPKDKILEIYLNHIYLGSNSYGVVVAAKSYFNKNINELSLEEAAVLAALPKAPSTLDPYVNKPKCLIRRNWVLNRMMIEGYITYDEYNNAIKNPIILNNGRPKKFAWGFVDEARNMISKTLEIENDEIPLRGYHVYTTLDSKLQKIAQNALDEAMVAYTKKHGYKGPIAKIALNGWMEALSEIIVPDKIKNFQLAVVLGFIDDDVLIGLTDGSKKVLSFSSMLWARKYISPSKVGDKVESSGDVVELGDVIVVKKDDKNDSYSFEQIPELNGSVVIMSPKTGQIHALIGGYGDIPGTFNRATQANRQIGSTIKPFVYAAALEKGFQLDSIFIDSELVYRLQDGEVWSPRNAGLNYSGPVTMRQGLERSINVVTVKVADATGLSKIISLANRFDLLNSYRKDLSLALGSGESTLLQLVRAFSIIANGGKRVDYSLIKEMCLSDNCVEGSIVDEDLFKEKIAFTGNEQILDPITNYQVYSLMRGVVLRGNAGRRSRSIRLPFVGKTGTSQNGKDLWFVGMTPDIAIGVFVGYDLPKTTGNEYGATIALPIFVNILEKIQKDIPIAELPIPEDAKIVKITRSNGKRTDKPFGGDVIYEIFRPDDVLPGYSDDIIDEDELTGLY